MGTYASQSDLTTRFGTTNIGKWSQTDPTTDSDTIDTAAVAEAIADAEARINDRMRPSRYQLPLTANSSGALQAVKRWTCNYAAAWLYQSRPAGITTDTASMIESLELKTNDEIDAVVSGSTHLDCPLKTGGYGYTATSPTVVM